jgi:AcrR family transcriptional regulator
MVARELGVRQRAPVARNRPKAKPRNSARRLHGRASNAAGRQTRAAILESAERVLVEHGHRGLTIRAVASNCGVSIGNLHYHFPSIDVLVAALVNSAVQRYQNEFEQRLSGLKPKSADEFVDLTGWLVLDAGDPEVNRLFREFWAMESSHPPVAEAMASFYRELTHLVTVAMTTVFPHVPQQRLLQIARLMAMLAEGSAIVGGSDRIAQRTPTDKLARIARDAVRSQLSQLNPDGRKSSGKSRIPRRHPLGRDT